MPTLLLLRETRTQPSRKILRYYVENGKWELKQEPKGCEEEEGELRVCEYIQTTVRVVNKER